MTSFIDTHCHLDKLDSTPEEAVKQAKKEGVKTMVTISVDEESFDFVSNAVIQFKDVYGTVGIHPHECLNSIHLWSRASVNWSQEHDKIIAIGETGLDYYYMNSSMQRIRSLHS